MAHGMPVSDMLARQLNVRRMSLEPSQVSNSALCARVGNSMHFACIGLALTAAVLGTMPLDA